MKKEISPAVVVVIVVIVLVVVGVAYKLFTGGSKGEQMSDEKLKAMQMQKGQVGQGGFVGPEAMQMKMKQQQQAGSKAPGGQGN